MVETAPNSSPSFLKKLPNKVIELLFLPLLYPPPFFNFQTGHNTLVHLKEKKNFTCHHANTLGHFLEPIYYLMSHIYFILIINSYNWGERI